MKEIQNSDSLPKLRTFKTYKNYFKQENYLSVIKDCRYMTSLVRFHISSHNLKIETGRYTRPKTEIYQRICTYCNSHEVENVTHFLCKCTYFIDERNLLYRTCSKLIHEIQNMNHENILMQLLPSTDPSSNPGHCQIHTHLF